MMQVVLTQRSLSTAEYKVWVTVSCMHTYVRARVCVYVERRSVYVHVHSAPVQSEHGE